MDFYMAYFAQAFVKMKSGQFNGIVMTIRMFERNFALLFI